MTQEEKKSYAVKWWGVLPDDNIQKVLSISYKSLDRYVKNKKDEFETQQKKQIFDWWMRCETQDMIAELTTIPQQTVSRIITGFTQNGQVSEMGKFRDFEREDSALRIYDIWNFSKATNEVRHFGNIL